MDDAADAEDEADGGRQAPAPADDLQVVGEVELRPRALQQSVGGGEVGGGRERLQKNDSLTTTTSPSLRVGSGMRPASTAL